MNGEFQPARSHLFHYANTAPLAHIAEIIGKIFGGPLGEGGNQDALADFRSLAAKLDRLVNLIFQGADGDPGIQKPGRPDDLLRDQAGAGSFDIKIRERRGR